MSGPRAQWRVARPGPALRPLVRRYIGYRLRGYPAGIHLGLPSPHLTIVVSFDEALEMVEMPDPAQAPARFPTLASGLSTRRAAMRHDGRDHGVQLELTPLGARSLLGLPAGALGAAVVGLGDLMGPSVRSLPERLAERPTWPARFHLLDEVLQAGADRMGRPAPALSRAWQLLIEGRTPVRVGEVAREVGWSRRHLGARFAREFGVTPKDAAQLARFARARALMGGPDVPNLAHVAAHAGYYDQSHLVRDWQRFAGCAPSVWQADEQLPSVQDGAG